jgi:hypothetical protein
VRFCRPTGLSWQGIALCSAELAQPTAGSAPGITRILAQG